MRRSLVRLIAATIALIAIAPAAQAADPSQAFEAGTASFAESDYLRALAYFKEARDAGLNSVAVDYNIAVCHYKLGDYREAAAEFSVIADRYPAMRGLAKYNLGLVALKQSDEAAAERHFRAALNSEDETVRFLASRQLGTSDAAGERRDWFTLVDARFGHDDNVLLLAEEVTLPNGQSAESEFTEFLAFVSGPIRTTPGFRFDGSIFAVRYPTASMFDQTMFSIGAAYQAEWGTWRTEFGPYAAYSTLDGDSFEERVGIAVRLRRNLGANAALRIGFTHDDVSEGDGRFAAFAGARDWLELRFDRQFAAGRVSLAYAMEENDRDAATVSPSRKKLSLRYGRPVGAAWMTELQLALKESSFDELAEPRAEDLTELALQATRNFQRSWQLTSGVSLADNASAVSTVVYERTRYSIGFAKQF
jgi:tetratricopeptide (TPR) repeat protein